MSELRNPTATRWDFDKFFRKAGYEPCFSRGVTFADVDAEIEINGHFLVIEGKRTAQNLEIGQARAMTARVRDGRVCLVVFGQPETGEVTHLQRWGNAQVQAIPIPATLEDLWKFCRAWDRWARMEVQPKSRLSNFDGDLCR